MKNSVLKYYYIVLILVMIFYTSMVGAPMIFRLAYLAALLLPLTIHIKYFPAVLIITLLISQNTFAYPLVPDDNYYYIIITLFFAMLSVSGINKTMTLAKKNRLSIYFVFLILYLAITNLLTDGRILMLTSSVFICTMLYICANRYLAVNSLMISVAFMVFTLAMSYWIVFHPEARVLAAHGEEEMTWADPNYLCGMAGIGCVIAVMRLLYSKKSAFQIIFCILTIAGAMYFAAIMASRGAILAIGVSSIVLVLFSKANKRTKSVVFIFIVAAILFVYYSKTFDLLLSRFNEEDTTGSGRTIIWLAKLKGFVQEGSVSNIIFGFGVQGGYSVGYSTLGKIWAFHNDFIAVLIEYGLTGFIFYVSSLAYPFRIAKKEDKPVIAALLLYIVTLGMTLEPVIYGRFVFVVFILYIIILAKSGVKESL